MTGNVRRLSSVVKSPFRGKYYRPSELVGYTLIISDIKPFVGQYGPAYIISFALDTGEIGFAISPAKVVTDKLQQVKDADAFPVEAKWIKRGRYYDLVDSDAEEEDAAIDSGPDETDTIASDEPSSNGGGIPF